MATIHERSRVAFVKVAVLLGMLTTALAANYLFAAWQSPPANPPDSNVDAPVNIGTTDQVKDAGLSVDALTVFGDGYVQNELGIGTTDPLHDLQISDGSVTASLLLAGPNQTADSSAVYFGDALSESAPGYQGMSIVYDSSANELRIRDESNTTDRVTFERDGNVGIKYGSPSSPLEVNGTVEADQYCDRSKSNCFTAGDVGGSGSTCPSGFTKIGKLGCIQSNEEGSANYWDANDSCFDTYEGRLTTTAEWYAAADNFSLSNESDDYEWFADAKSDNVGFIIRGDSGARDVASVGMHNVHTFRCFIPSH